jgi:hypothetical protein
MAANSGAFGAKPGYNQSGGGYYVAFSSIASSIILNVNAVGSGSGGAFTQATVSTLVPAGGLSSIVTPTGAIPAGRVLRDMGKTLTSSTRVFRKFQLAVPNTQSSGGVSGNVPPQTNYPGDVGYLTFYLEVSRDGASTAANAPIARSFF